MQQSNVKLNGTAYADHLRGCADLAVEIAGRMDIRDDSARQACFATVIINAERHNIFMEPVPKDFKTPVIQPEGAVASNATVNGDDQKRDEAAAAKADAQVKEIVPNPTPEQSEAARRQALEKGIDSAINLLNKAGHVPPITIGGLNTYIKGKFEGKANRSFLDMDELEKLTMMLSAKLDKLRESKGSAKRPDEIDW